ncbi:hypothetical protein JAAARDRAFT_160991 [Jaapia argillacea MUCL 33604]|uniref:Cytochrome P450 n=1 Tax=Jaapia argillacea MUCL 33604 TaxID=933084 RepID=A0A067PGZ4_9AGAM|nr:hypothetical protein JAAARDRAFT_160991 [Jaapia argillacea MUCL 33604]
MSALNRSMSQLHLATSRFDFDLQPFLVYLKPLILSAGASVLAYNLYRLVKLVLRPVFSPLRRLQGPPSDSWFYGNFRQVFTSENSTLQEEWVAEYGHTLKYKGMFNLDRIVTTDLRAIQHILSNSIYEKPPQARFFLSRVLGEGLLLVEGEEHKNQRRIMSPAFGLAHLREITDIFMEKSIELRDIWMSQIASETTEDQPIRLDVLSWLSRMTLDVIGLAGFNYKFNSLSAHLKPTELSKAFGTIFEKGQQMSLLALLQAFIPPLRLIPTQRDWSMKKARKTMDRIGRELLAEKKAAIATSIAAERGENKVTEVGKNSVQGKDLLSLLVRANMATDLKDSQRLSDEDVLAQVPTFLTAGHETTSTATTWSLYALALAPEVQSKLRQELLSVPTDTPTMDELQALPYLDAVVRESLRVHAPVPSTTRVVMRDDVVPLSTPIVDKDGRSLSEIRLWKGDTVFIPIVAVNRSKLLWGEDAFEFKPERWENPPQAINSIPGVWGNMLTFLGGHHACIGFRFSVVETKAILFTLLRAFEFELAVPKEDVIKKATIVQRPFIKSATDKKSQLPMFVGAYKGS